MDKAYDKKIYKKQVCLQNPFYYFGSPNTYF